MQADLELAKSKAAALQQQIDSLGKNISECISLIDLLYVGLTDWIKSRRRINDLYAVVNIKHDWFSPAITISLPRKIIIFCSRIYCISLQNEWTLILQRAERNLNIGAPDFVVSYTTVTFSSMVWSTSVCYSIPQIQHEIVFFRDKSCFTRRKIRLPRSSCEHWSEMEGDFYVNPEQAYMIRWKMYIHTYWQ